MMNLKCPNWKEEELVLVLDLYMKHDIKWLNSASEKTNEIIDISNILKNLNLFSDDLIKIPNFRSPSSVHMKLMNFKGLDPKYGKYGLRNASNLDREVWSRYSNNKEKLKMKVNIVLKSCGKEQTEIPIDCGEENVRCKLRSCLGYLKEFNALCSEIRKDAINMPDIDMSQKVINCMYKELTFSNQSLIILEDLVNEVGNNKTHNVEEVKSNYIEDRKIGKYVQDTFLDVIYREKLSIEDIQKLMDEDWSRNIFHIEYPFLKKLQNNIPVKMQVKVGKYQRYWEKEFIIFDNKYLVCKEWYESNRNAYDYWLKNIQLGENQKLSGSSDKNLDLVTLAGENASITINKELLVDILNAIKKFDEKEICIETGKLNDFLKDEIVTKSNYKNSQQVIFAIIKYLVDSSIIVPFQNSERCKYVIEDYELMTNLINNPVYVNEGFER